MRTVCCGSTLFAGAFSASCLMAAAPSRSVVDTPAASLPALGCDGCIHFETASDGGSRCLSPGCLASVRALRYHWGMADTSVQREVEHWIREQWMKARLAQPFVQDRVRLSSGGVFEADAVSADRSIVACISTSGARTASGKLAVGKVHKIRSDMFFLSIADGVRRRLVVLTERDMYELFAKEQRGGRVPSIFEFVVADIPDELRSRLVIARMTASREVQPMTAGD